LGGHIGVASAWKILLADILINYPSCRGVECYNSFSIVLEVKKGRHKRRKEDRKEDDAIGIGKYNIDGLIMLNLN
jgi:hypothetical protein